MSCDTSFSTMLFFNFKKYFEFISWGAIAPSTWPPKSAPVAHQAARTYHPVSELSHKGHACGATRADPPGPTRAPHTRTALWTYHRAWLRRALASPHNSRGLVAESRWGLRSVLALTPPLHLCLQCYQRR